MIEVNSTEADFELLVTVIVSGGLIRETTTLPKSCLSGLILSVPPIACGPTTMRISRDGVLRGSGWDIFASGAVARSAAIARSYTTSPVAAVSSATSTHTAGRAELNVNMKFPPRPS
jgi:hypothetical protein